MLKFIVSIPQASLPALYAVPDIQISTAEGSGATPKAGKAKTAKPINRTELAGAEIEPFLAKQKAPIPMAALTAQLKTKYPDWDRPEGDAWRNACNRAMVQFVEQGKAIAIGSGSHTSYMWNKAHAATPKAARAAQVNLSAGSFDIIRGVIADGELVANDGVLAAAFEAKGSSALSARLMCGKMQAAGEIEKVNDVWQFTALGEERYTKPPVNGHDING